AILFFIVSLLSDVLDRLALSISAGRVALPRPRRNLETSGLCSRLPFMTAPPHDSARRCLRWPPRCARRTAPPALPLAPAPQRTAPRRRARAFRRRAGR